MIDLFDWTPPPGYPNSPGFKEPTTSRDAAERVAPVARTLRDQVLQALRVRWPSGMTADEVAAALGKREFSIRPRLSELKGLDAIQDSTVRRPNESGMKAIVWVARRSHGEWP